MNYVTVTAPTYEEAVRKAKKQYGDGVRIHSRKDVKRKGIFGLSDSIKCELTCFIAEKSAQSGDVSDSGDKKSQKKINAEDKSHAYSEAADEQHLKRFDDKPMSEGANDTYSTEKNRDETEENIDNKTYKVKEKIGIDKISSDKLEKTEYWLNIAQKLLEKNDFSETYTQWCRDEMQADIVSSDLEALKSEDVQMILLDKIAKSVVIDRKMQVHPARICVFLGLNGSGKTSTLMKLAAVFSSVESENKRDVRIVTLDDNENAAQQLADFGRAVGVPVDVAVHENDMEIALTQMSEDELILIDTCGKSPNSSEPDYKLYGLLNTADANSTRYFIVLPAVLKNSDINLVFEQFGAFPLSGIIVTKMDETSTIGNIISASRDKNLPLVFTSDGKKIPRDIKRVSMNILLEMLKGFSIDLSKFGNDEV